MFGGKVALRSEAVPTFELTFRSVFTEERNSLLGGDDDGSGSELSANLCEIEESDAETEALAPAARHTDV